MYLRRTKETVFCARVSNETPSRRTIIRRMNDNGAHDVITSLISNGPQTADYVIKTSRIKLRTTNVYMERTYKRSILPINS